VEWNSIAPPIRHDRFVFVGNVESDLRQVGAPSAVEFQRFTARRPAGKAASVGQPHEAINSVFMCALVGAVFELSSACRAAERVAGAFFKFFAEATGVFKVEVIGNGKSVAFYLHLPTCPSGRCPAAVNGVEVRDDA